jgi:hypothetical protein
MSAYCKPDRCAWCRARLTPANAAVVGPDLVCAPCVAESRPYRSRGNWTRL